MHTIGGDRTAARHSQRAVALIIAGMHRSGTSAFTRALSLCGLELPRTLMAANTFNQDGYWESETIKQLNDALLGGLDSAWDDALASRVAREGSYSRESVESIKSAVRDQFAEGRDIIIKDPRISLLFGAWREALDDLGYEPVLVTPVRHPLEVAASLSKRDGFPILKSVLLWLGHLLALERDSRGVARAFIAYDDLLTDWRGCFKHLERATGFRLRNWTAAAEQSIDTFLLPERRHHVYDADLLDARADIPAWVGEAYRWALEAARAPAEPSHATLDAIAAQFHAAADVFAPLLAFERRRAAQHTQSEPVRGEPTGAAVQFTLYSATGASPYSEDTCVHHTTRLGATPETITIATPARNEPLTALRLDLADAPGRVLLHGLRVLDVDSAVIWEWSGDSALFRRESGVTAESLGDTLAVVEFLNDDPQTELPVGGALGAHRQARVEFTISAADEAALALARLHGGNAIELHKLGQKIAAAEEHDQRQAAAAEQMLAQLAHLRADLERLETRQGIDAALKQVEGAAEAPPQGPHPLQVELGALSERLTRLEADGGETRARLSEQISRLETDGSQTRARLTEQMSHIEGARRDARAQHAETLARIEASQADVAVRVGEQMAAAQASEAAADARVEQVSAFLERRLSGFNDDMAAQARGAAQANAEQVAALSTDVARRLDSVLAAFGAVEARLDALVETKLASLDAKLASTEAGIARIESDHVATTKLAHHLTQATHERDLALQTIETQKRDIAALMSSTSWRLTAPIRVLKRGPREMLSAARRAARRVKGALRRRLLGKSYADAAEAARDANEARLLQNSSLFDPDWYMATYPDVGLAGANPLLHYLRHGAFENRSPGPAFDSRWYLAQNPDVAAAGLNPLVHYLVAGKRENRAPLPPARHAPAKLAEHMKLLGNARHWKHLTASGLLTLDAVLPRKLARRLQAARHANAPRAEDKSTVADNSVHAETFDQLFTAASTRGVEYVPLAPEPMTETPRVKAIAFYLPQFHPIPENDAWWGKGFTEWTNVSKAAPQFVGHYQPRLPDELGYYDLRVPDVQRRQVELAKHYGLHGFCFHYYWFTGRKRLLERPLNQFLGSDIDFPFCVCWANENWTRRWDGMDQDILMEQRHEPQDDYEFIEDLAPALRDPRYIRIEGRPLIIVYRVDILPNPQRTAQVWRDYCRAHGLGDPLLVAAQTFGIRDPRPYGFDAAVEFPPHNDYGDEEITHEQKFLNPKAEGRVYSYPKVARHYAEFSFPDYKLFKGIIPSWDNEARKPGRAYAFARATPALYRSWLTALCRKIDAEAQSADEKFVFINAWNEWAEGAYLEPDRRFGYGYLEATRDALATVSEAPAPVRHEIAPPAAPLGLVAPSDPTPAPAPTPAPIAEPPLVVIVHAYYHDVFDEVLTYLSRLKRKFSLYVTCPPERTLAVRGTFEDSGLDCPFELIEVENRGRDVLAFFEVLRRAPIPDDAVILKIHTKRSTHRSDGAAWRRELFDRLLAPDVINKSMRAFATDASLGLVAPETYLAPITTYLGFNQARIEELLRRGGWGGIRQDDDVFAAGTMFFVRRRSLDPLLALGFTREDFETEAGQVDGTLAHALERMFALVILREGGRITDTSALSGGAWSSADFNFAVKTDYLYKPDGGS